MSFRKKSQKNYGSCATTVSKLLRNLRLIFLGSLLVVGHAFAIDNSTFDEIFGPNFDSWKGVFFTCDLNPKTQLTLEVCERIGEEFEVLTSSLGITSELGLQDDFIGNSMRRASNEYLSMELRLWALPNNNFIYGDLGYSIFLSQPHSDGSRTVKGNLDFMNTPVIAAGDKDELVLVISKHFKEPMKNMLEAYRRNN